MGVTNLVGAAYGSGEDLYGKKVKVPDYWDMDEAHKSTVASNITNLPDILKITGTINKFNQDQILSMLREAAPQYDAMQGKTADTIMSGLRGEVPQDLQDFMSRKAAERSVSGGYGGTGMQRNLELRDLGMTSFQITQKSMDSASRWMAQASAMATAPLFDPTSMFLTPSQTMAHRDGKFERDLYQAEMDASPDPVARGRFDSEMELLGMVLSAYGGGSGYKGGDKKKEKDKREKNEVNDAMGQSANDRYIPRNEAYTPNNTDNWQGASTGSGKTFSLF